MAPRYSSNDQVKPKPRKFTPGIPDTTKPWHGNDSIYRQLRLKDMHRNGYIDYPGRWPGVDEYFQVYQDTHDNVNDPGNSDYSFIHPVFRQENWSSIPKDHFKCIEPALRLASSILCEPVVLRFFQALLHRPWKRIVDSNAEIRLKRPLYQFGVTDLSSEDLSDTLKTLHHIQNHVRWDFANKSKLGAAHAVTSEDRSKSGVIPGAFSAKVNFKIEFLQVLRGDIKCTDFPKAKGFDDRAAVCRTILFFANILVHELCHVVFVNHNPHQPGKKAMEPFWRDDRLAETGWAFSQTVFNCGFQPLGHNPKSVACPYGLATIRFPGGLSYGTARASRARYRHVYTTRGAVPATYCHKFLTRRFWAVDMQRDMEGHAMKVEWKLAVQNALVDPSASEFLPEEPNSPISNPPDSPGAPSRQEIELMGFKFKNADDVYQTSEDTDDDDNGAKVT